MELPFTAFGQFSEDTLDLRVFDQGVYWVDRTGKPHLLEAMPLRYIANVIEFLVNLREQYFADCTRRAVVQALGDHLLFGGPVAEVLATDIGGPAWSDLTAEEWLEATPLMRALRKRSTDSSHE